MDLSMLRLIEHAYQALWLLSELKKLESSDRFFNKSKVVAVASLKFWEIVTTAAGKTKTKVGSTKVW